MKRTRILWTLLPGVLLALLALATQAQILRTIDYETTLLFQSVIPRSVDLPFSILSLAGSFEITTILLLVLVLCFYPPKEGILTFACFLLILFIEWLGKTVIHQLGPPHMFNRYVIFFAMPTGNVETLYSFPSGHAARSVFLCLVAIALIRQSRLQAPRKGLAVGLVVIAGLLMLVSRVYLGDHWASDVVGGTLLGAWLALPTRAPLAIHPSLARIRL